MKPEELKKKEIEAALKLLHEDKEKKVKDCAEEIQSILDKHGMKIDVQSAVTITPK